MSLYGRHVFWLNRKTGCETILHVIENLYAKCITRVLNCLLRPLALMLDYWEMQWQLSYQTFIMKRGNLGLKVVSVIKQLFILTSMLKVWGLNISSVCSSDLVSNNPLGKHLALLFKLSSCCLALNRSCTTGLTVVVELRAPKQWVIRLIINIQLLIGCFNDKMLHLCWGGAMMGRLNSFSKLMTNNVK